MYTCMCLLVLHEHVCMHAHLPVFDLYVCMHAHVCVCVCICQCAYMHMCVLISVSHVYMCIFTSVHMNMCVFTCKYVCWSEVCLRNLEFETWQKNRRNQNIKGDDMTVNTP